MFKLFKKKDEKPILKDELKVEVYNAIERRKYVRVLYPPIGAVGDLPTLDFKGHSIVPRNFSLGGMFLSKPPLGEPRIGENYEFQVNWRTSAPTPIIAKLLIVKDGNWHFEFTKKDFKFPIIFERVFRSGVQGNFLRKFERHEIPKDAQNIIELWMSEKGDFVLFENSGAKEIASFSYEGVRVQLSEDWTAILVERQNDGHWVHKSKAPEEFVHQLLMFACNAHTPSERLSSVINGLLQRYYRSQLNAA